MRDFNPINRVQQCPSCRNYKGDPGIVYPEDNLATKQPDGSWKCGKCQDRELQDRIVRVTPNSERSKEIIAERKKEEKKYKQLKMFEAMIRNMPGKLVR